MATRGPERDHVENSIITYSAVHTGAKSRFGGRHDGFFKRSYHSPGRKKVPVMAARKQAAMKPSNGTQEDTSIATPQSDRHHRSVVARRARAKLLSRIRKARRCRSRAVCQKLGLHLDGGIAFPWRRSS